MGGAIVSVLARVATGPIRLLTTRGGSAVSAGSCLGAYFRLIGDSAAVAAGGDKVDGCADGMLLLR
jgi:hypothetical protein